MEDVDGGPTKKRGVKRMADESNLSDDQRFAKRFNLLNLGSHATHKSYVYTPVLPAHETGSRLESSTSPLDGMQVDDTKDRVYIGNLDAEIADIEAHEPQERMVFLPDIEKHFSRIPHQVLVGNTVRSEQDAEAQQLVLYQEPKLLTSNESHSSVKRAILESRKRAQEKATTEARKEEHTRNIVAAEGQHGYALADGHQDRVVGEEDTDVMDVD